MLPTNEIHLSHPLGSPLAEEGTSPASPPRPEKNFSSPSKKHQSMPAMRSPEKRKVSLLNTPPAHSSTEEGTEIESFKSPKGSSTLKARPMTSPADTGDSPRSVKSPRSQRSEHEVMQSSRHRIESPRSHHGIDRNSGITSTLHTTVAQAVTTTITTTTTTTAVNTAGATPTSPPKTPAQRQSAPPNTISLNQPAAEQFNSLADLWIEQLLSSADTKSGGASGVLTLHQINALGRMDYKIAASSLPDSLQSLKISPDKLGKVSLSHLLRSLLANHLSQSDAGKTIFAMLTVLAQAHPEMLLVQTSDLTDMDVDEANAIKKTMSDAMQAQVKACVQMIFGQDQQWQQSRLPSSLLEFWRRLDAKLVKEAARNPNLTAAQVLTARQNLGFDLLITRQLYPYAMKPVKPSSINGGKEVHASSDTDASVMSVVFANAMREELRRQWPLFCADAIRHFDA